MRRYLVLLKRELKRAISYPLGTGFLALGTLLFGYYYPMLYPTPPPPQEICISLSGFALASYEGFFPFLAALLAALSVAGDVEKGVMATLLTYPAKRRDQIISKFLALFLVTSILSCVSLLSGLYVCVLRSGLQAPAALYVVIALVMLLLSFLYLSIPLLISTLTDRPLVAALTTLILFIAWGYMIPSVPVGDLLGIDKWILLLKPGGASQAIVWVALSLQPPPRWRMSISFTFWDAVYATAWMTLLSMACLILALLIFEKKQL